MESAFNLLAQHNDPDAKIVVAFERISEAFRVLLWEQSKRYGLSPIQIQILIYCLFQKQENCTVGNLAVDYNMTKATISDSVKVLLKKELVTKNINPSDTRSYTIGLSQKGNTIAKEAAKFTNSLTSVTNSLNTDTKNILLGSLMEIIKQLNSIGIISPQRMCLSCKFLKDSGDTYYCSFLKSELETKELRIDCPEFSGNDAA